MALTSDVSMFITDTPVCVVVPRPTPETLGVPSLVQTTDSTVSSPVVDFEAQGVGPGDVLKILTGLNRGSYVVRSVEANTLAVAESFRAVDTTTVTAEVQAQRVASPHLEADLVVSQPGYNQRFISSAGLDVSLG